VASVSTTANSAGALQMLRDVEVDVAFIEVGLPGMDGMELAWVLKRFHAPPAVVFISRYSERAAEAFDLGAVDYLSKPPDPYRLAKSLRRVAAVRRVARPAPPRTPTAVPPATAMPATTTPATTTPATATPATATPATTMPATAMPGGGSAARAPVDTGDEAIPVELGDTTRLVWRSTVQWVQAHGDYVRLHTADGSYLIRARLASLADCWRSAGMVRIHRSYLVQLQFVTEVQIAESGQVAVVVGGHQLPVSRRMERELRSQLRTAARVTRSTPPRPTR
jgi:DNA-binding LytR/AlgR family response regulator